MSIWNFPQNENGFLASIRDLEKNSYSSFFKSKRAKSLLQNTHCSISDLLTILVGNENYFENYLFDQQFSHRGWSGMVATVEAFPSTLFEQKKISLQELIHFELLLEIDALDNSLGNSWQPLFQNAKENPPNLFSDVHKTELQEVFTLWQLAFEWSYYDEVLAGLQSTAPNTTSLDNSKSFQAIFCIDERECSLRRHLEQVDPDCETLGSPGFFGVEFYFQPQNAKFYDKLCPAPVTPKFLIKEFDVKDERKHEFLYTNKTFTLANGFATTLTLGFAAGIRLVQNLVQPKMSPAISNAFSLMHKNSKLTIENLNLNDRENDLQIGFTIEEMAIRVEAFLRSIGLIKNFASLIYVVAHGSSSANNPHHGAHDCGACSGRPGAVNARVLSFMANHLKVREILAQNGIQIPNETQFVGALHDTAGDEIEYYDDSEIQPHHLASHAQHIISFEKALDLNAKERSRRFASINTAESLNKVRKAIKDRSVSLFEPRPELGHGTNTLCIVGSRNLTKGLFLDRRAFLNSYDYRTDLDGKILTNVMKPLGPVCGGINLEYYFSRVDNHKLGAGTKLPHHVMGLFGVANSVDGDLRPGLPLQMIEVHDPVRLLIVVEHFPDIVLKTIQSVPEMYEWYINEWVHLIVIHPEKSSFHYFKEGQFETYTPKQKSIPSISNMQTFIESAIEMKTNYIVDATEENLAIHSIH
ncbi:MAG TPA: Na-translocating system protein MpsB [Chitinophagaceae bacterium]|nr:Na-translocating system protein MpsB [Chitinophagaceae bacterium]